MYLCQFAPAIKRLKPVLSVPSTFSSVQSVLCVPACKRCRPNWPKLNFSRNSSLDMFFTFSSRQPVSMPKKLENKWWTERRKKRNTCYVHIETDLHTALKRAVTRGVVQDNRPVTRQQNTRGKKKKKRSSGKTFADGANEWKLCTIDRNLPHAKLKRSHVTMLHRTTKQQMSLSSYQLAISSKNIVLVMKSVVPRALLHLERLVHFKAFRFV